MNTYKNRTITRIHKDGSMSEININKDYCDDFIHIAKCGNINIHKPINTDDYEWIDANMQFGQGSFSNPYKQHN